MALTKVSRGLLSTGIVDNSTTTAITIDSSENVGIGTGSPSSQLEIDESGSGDATIKVGNAQNVYTTNVGKQGATAYGATAAGAAFLYTFDNDISIMSDGSAGSIKFTTGGNTQKMVLDASGNLVVGASSASAKLTVGTFGDTARAAQFHGGNILIDGGAATEIIMGDGNVAYMSIQTTDDATAMKIRNYSGNSDLVTVDRASGNVLVGQTSNAETGTGIGLVPDGTSHMYSGGTDALMLGRGGSDGDILSFNKSGTTVGSLLTNGGRFAFIGTKGGVSAGFDFEANTKALRPVNGDGNSSDNTHDIGRADVRWKDIRATNGTIQTSDRNEKQDIEALSDAERRVAVAAKGLMRKFRWKDAVAEKGDNARIHFGIIAQDLQAAFEAEGLDAARYGMWCSDTWTDEDTGEERTRLGVRYSELLAFIIAAI